MATRTYRVSLVGESAHTAKALEALDRLFSDEALRLLEQQVAPAGLSVQRLASDGTEVVLFITPSASATEMPPVTTLLATAAHGGGGSMSSEEPVP